MAKKTTSPFKRPDELGNSPRHKKERGKAVGRNVARQIKRSGVLMSHEEVVERFCVPLDPEEGERRRRYRARMSAEIPTVSLYYADLGKLTEQQRSFLVAYAEHGVIKEACLAARVSRRVVMDWIENDASFKEEFDLAEEEATDDLEIHAINRAKAVSDPLMSLMLKAKRPEKYMERAAIDLSKKKEKKQSWQIGDFRLEF